MSITVGPARHVAASIHDHGVVLLHTKDGRMFASNHTGACIWQGVERNLPVDAIADEISRRFQIAGETARSHTSHFLAELERQRLVARRPGL